MNFHETDCTEKSKKDSGLETSHTSKFNIETLLRSLRQPRLICFLSRKSRFTFQPWHLESSYLSEQTHFATELQAKFKQNKFCHRVLRLIFINWLHHCDIYWSEMWSNNMAYAVRFTTSRLLLPVWWRFHVKFSWSFKLPSHDVLLAAIVRKSTYWRFRYFKVVTILESL